MLEQTRLWVLIEKLQRLQSIDILDKVIDREILNAIAQLNKEQLQEGERADGSSLPDYSAVSVEVYGKPRGAMTLKDTGDFYESFAPIVLDRVIKIVSQPYKEDAITGEITNLEEVYNPLGLQDENLEKIRNKVKTKIIEYIKELLHASR